MQVMIRGDQKKYVVGGITKSMTTKDVAKKFLDTCTTKYGQKIKSINFDLLKFKPEASDYLNDYYASMRLEEFTTKKPATFFDMITKCLEVVPPSSWIRYNGDYKFQKLTEAEFNAI